MTFRTKFLLVSSLFVLTCVPPNNPISAYGYFVPRLSLFSKVSYGPWLATKRLGQRSVSQAPSIRRRHYPRDFPRGFSTWLLDSLCRALCPVFVDSFTGFDLVLSKFLFWTQRKVLSKSLEVTTEACRGYSRCDLVGKEKISGAKCDIKMRDCEIRLIPGRAPWSRNVTHDTTTTWPRSHGHTMTIFFYI